MEVVRPRFRSGPVRDALALVRLLYLEADELPVDLARTDALLGIGRALARACRTQHQGGAVEAVEQLEDLPEERGAIAALVRRAAERVRGGPRGRPPSEWDARRQARALRG